MGHTNIVLSRSQTVTIAETWTTAVERFVLSSPGSSVGARLLRADTFKNAQLRPNVHYVINEKH